MLKVKQNQRTFILPHPPALIGLHLMFLKTKLWHLNYLNNPADYTFLHKVDAREHFAFPFL